MRQELPWPLRKIRSAFIRTQRFFVSQRFGFPPDKIYTDNFYDGGGFALTEATASKISSYLVQEYSPRSVFDFGCGPGAYLRSFSELGVTAVGCDGAPDGVKRAADSALAFVHDLRKPLVINRSFDLVICVEVAEHLPKSFSNTLVSSICEAANTLIAFTAAPPGCPGDDHINCQPIEFWQEKFKPHGFFIDEGATQQLRDFSSENDLAKWWQGWSYILLKQNTDI